MMQKPIIKDDTDCSDIAIIGVAGRFPGAKNTQEFWQNIKNGVESVTWFSEQTLEESGINPTIINNDNYIKAGYILEDIDLFDASFFGFNAKEAEITDPQQRLFLECAWQALENAGYDADRYEGLIGVYAGAYVSNYLLFNIPKIQPENSLNILETLIANDKDFLPTRICYKLNLKGPGINIQSACSTSLVAVHVACQSLLNGETDIALAGGVAINIPQKAGYFYQEEGILSPDGHCRAFDAKAKGTIFGSGLGIVVLKRLAEALEDGDCIHAVIKGSAINNDGSQKASYTAPSVDGQTEVITEALANAGVNPETINYIETHGTGTFLGDPVEIAALTKAFRNSSQKKSYCAMPGAGVAIASVKSNIGHLNAASGIAGLIKTVLALQHKTIPPSLHFEQPNPQIDFDNSPFYVNTQLTDWPAHNNPRRAGVSSFGVGGTNAHVVLEEAPLPVASGKSRPWQLLLISAKTATSLDTLTNNLIEHCHQHPEINLADVAYTLNLGRKAFNHRRILVCQTLDQADPQRMFSQVLESTARSVVFMFSGQGTQYVNMGAELYQFEPTFRHYVDTCSDILKPHLGIDLRHILYSTETNSQQLQQTAIAQPALFVIEYALAKLWMSWGVHPQSMIGHSIGEYVAATLAGVFSLEDALALVSARGKLMQQLPSGAMLAVPLRETEVRSLLGELSLAAINAPSLCVVSGAIADIEVLQEQLTSQGLKCRRLITSHAFHSAMMEPILESYAQHVKKVNLNPPQIPYISNLTGTWITTEEATNPNYWVKHLRSTVQFAAGVQELLQEPTQILLEVGAGNTLSTLVRQHSAKQAEQVILSSIRHPQERRSDVEFVLQTLGHLWLSGVKVDWSGFYQYEQRHRLPLPTYPFERQRYWIDSQKQNDRSVQLGKKPDIADWFYLPLWKQSVLPVQKLAPQESTYLVFIDECGVGSELVQELEQQGQKVITVEVGAEFTQLADGLYTLNPEQSHDYQLLINELLDKNQLPTNIVHLWSVTPDTNTNLELEISEKIQELGFYSLLFLTQALTKHNLLNKLQILVIANNLHDINGEEILCPAKATILGTINVISQEYPNIICRSIDISLPITQQLTYQILTEINTQSFDQFIAYRKNHRWVQSFESISLKSDAKLTNRLRPSGIYLITGGLGSIGLVIAEYLAKTVQAKLILTGRSTFPAKHEWKQWLVTHDNQDSISCKIRKLQELEELGAEVLVINADVANLDEMQKVIYQIHQQFGQLHGVIHAAGTFGETFSSAISKIDKSTCQQQFRPKVNGLLVLEKVLQGEKLDFCLLLSSISSVLGGLGYVAYSAANIFMDTFAHRYADINSIPWVSVNLDTWKVGDESEIGRSLTEFAILPEEGFQAFQKILSSSNFHQIIVSTGDLQSRIKRWIQQDFSTLENGSQINNSQSLHARPNLQNAYVAPRNEIEQTLTNIWQELLGVAQIGIYDNFFDLGGHSLLATQVISRLREKLQINLPANSLYEVPTVADISIYIENQRLINQTFQLVANGTAGDREEGVL